MPNPIKVSDVNSAELLNAGLYDAGALIRIQSAATETGTYADVSGTGSTPTIAIVAGTDTYTGYDPNGTSTSWYRIRYENVGASRTSAWSAAFQVGTNASGQATGTYATVAHVKTRYTIADTTDDSILARLCDQVNAWIESDAGAGRILAPVNSAVHLLNGYDAVKGATLLYVRDGIRAISLLEVAVTTGGTFTTVPSTDYFLVPVAQKRSPGWPAIGIQLSDVPTGGVMQFFPGYENVRVTMTTGWAAMPDEIIDIAEFLVVRAYTARRAGQTDQTGPDGYPQPVIGRGVPAAMRDTLERYKRGI